MEPEHAPAAATALEPTGPDGGEKRHKERKEKKNKKEKKHKKHHKKDRHRSRTRSRTPHGAGSSDDEAGIAEQPVEQAAAVVDVPGAEGQGGAATEPPPLPADAAKPPATATVAAAGAEDAEEGELPDQLPLDPAKPGPDRGPDDVEEPSRRSGSRSPSKQRGSDSVAARRDRSRDGAAPRSRSRSQRRDAGGPASGGRPGRERDSSRLRSRSPGRRRSRSAERGAGGARPRTRSPPRRDRDRPPPPQPRDRDYRRDLDRRDERRPDYGRERYGGPARYDDRRRFDDRRRPRSRSVEGSRDARKRSRSRSEDRRQQDKQQQQQQEEDEEFQRRVAAKLEQAGEEDEDRLIEERRRRRQAILAKHRSQQGLDQMAAAPTATHLAQKEEEQQPQQAAAAPPPEGQPADAPPLDANGSAPPSRAASPAGGVAEGDGNGDGEVMELSDDEDAVVAALGTTGGGALDIFRHDGGEPHPESPPGGDQPQSGTGEAMDTELERRMAARRQAEPDMFADDDDADDIFAATPADVKDKQAAAAAAQAGQTAPAAAPAAARKGLLDNYDDAEGYYNFQVGEVIGEAGGPQFEVYATHGRGVFSSVLRARDLAARDPDTGVVPEVAIKVIRSNETMYKAGQMERVILRKLSAADPEGRRHCIRMLGSFEYRNHLCLVFEAMDMNLRELTKRYGRGIGLSISAVRVYAQQMLVALYHLHNCGVLHADIKPDNILVNDRRTVVKLCDFGSAMFSGDNEITPYLVSRFYRAPEVILGLPYDHPMDVWSIGCVVYELFTGHILFPGKTNNEMLKLMMDVKGPFPKKMVKRAEFAFKHFEADPNMSFALLEEDPVTKRPVRRLIPNPTVKKDFSSLLAGQSPDRKKLAQLVDLLERMMQLDPDKRISPKDALRHPFIREPPAAAAK